MDSGATNQVVQNRQFGIGEEESQSFGGTKIIKLNN